ncbi:MAG: ATP-dependent sacrificial sulfur transferase LarE [Anaerolineae bacterium]
MRGPVSPPEGEAGKEAQVLEFLRAQAAVAVAFSGGTDSTYLLALALEALGPERVLAVTIASEFEPPEEVEEARALAAELGARHQVVPVSMLENERVVTNPADRCYWCKSALVAVLRQLEAQIGNMTLVYGANADDLRDYRPGERAAREGGMMAPLQMAGLTKPEIRALARARGLSNWDRPAAACLASRFPYGERLTAEGLNRVAEAERFLRVELGRRDLRVRSHDRIARIEVPPTAWEHLLENGRRQRIVERLRELGFVYVTLDLMGLRSGSMNDALKPS